MKTVHLCHPPPVTRPRPNNMQYYYTSEHHNNLGKLKLGVTLVLSDAQCIAGCDSSN